MKPRIRFLTGKYGGYWVCVHPYGFVGRGYSPAAAYGMMQQMVFELTITPWR